MEWPERHAARQPARAAGNHLSTMTSTATSPMAKDPEPGIRQPAGIAPHRYDCTGSRRRPRHRCSNFGPCRVGLAGQLGRPFAAAGLAGRRSGGRIPAGQLPIWAYEVAGITMRDALEIVLVLGLRFPEITGRRDFRDNLARP